ncbi:hypothetical protein [Pseudoduganella sp. OTU4001]|uniref:hypothetical protein n=1 Tax=Pseudoduganella sp. OTU4001 TaxID=3043854 RepID=UPI00313DAC6D
MHIKTICAALALLGAVSNAAADELAYSKQGCVIPTFPKVSTSEKEFQAVKASLAEWSACFNGFAERLAAAMPAGKAMSADVEQAYSRIVSDAEQVKQEVFAAHDAWLLRSEAHAQTIHQKQREELISLNPPMTRLPRGKQESVQVSLGSNRR